MDKLAKVRAEVEKLKSQLLRGACASQVAMETRCKEEAYNEVLAILDTMQEEPVSWLEEFKAKVDSMSKEDFKKVFDKYAIDFNEEPVSNDLEEAAKEYSGKSSHPLNNAFKAGANWQKQKDSIVSEDLEKVALLCYPKMSRISEPHGIIPADNESHYICDVNEENRKAFKTGANWQKEQDQSTIELAEDHAMFAGMEKMKEEMMAKAIDAELYSDGMLTPLIGVNDKEVVKDIKFGDKIKLIIIKDKKDI